jgi:hypothetical protein
MPIKAIGKSGVHFLARATLGGNAPIMKPSDPSTTCIYPTPNSVSEKISNK